ncbi:hypothetical protein TrCOL_g6276 [Triparma columacea]|uniref:Uncharacterized protein n=1 Tax=Triparma columacea TaxID=722753 RepID=A0A9W7G980_9STRA|nr:hypothetical protein TrCOL_g6276 [Triparma columacea]
MMRWLLLPVAFVCLEWSLLLSPSIVLDSTPVIWTTSATNASLSLKLPHTRVQAFELGWHAAQYAACLRTTPNDGCVAHVDAANAAVGPASRMTAEQLTQVNLQAELQLEDEERSIGQRVLGFFSFVNIIWVISIFGGLLTVGPFLLYVFGEQIVKVLKALYTDLLVPMHKLGVFELCAYAFTFLLSAQSCRYPVQHASAAQLVGLTGALGVLPCWAYSTSLWAGPSKGNEEKFMSLTGALVALSLAPLSLLHSSSLMGFFTVAAVYVACGFAMGPCFGGFYVGFRSFDAVTRCLLVSACFVVTFATLSIIDVAGPFLAPFALGARVLGNVGYFLALLLYSSKWRGRRRAILGYGASNGLMLVSLVSAMFVGSVFSLPSYTNTALTFFVLWIMEKQLEAKWGSAGIAVKFANFIALYGIAHHLNTHPEVITSIFDPSE